MHARRHHLLPVIILSLAVFFYCPATCAESKCETCQKIARQFKKGLDDTAKSNFGGGNTNWEERKLGSFANSETRFLEILEHVCDDSNKECHHMVEQQEEQLEQWFFLHYARGFDLDLDVFLCIDKLKVCCAPGTYGPTCSECVGSKDRPCSGNGRCDGDGTREGTGKCHCNGGYTGDLCTDCSSGFYEESRNETHTVCQACDRACNGSCTGAGRKSCTECREGWTASEEDGCVDVNECEREVNPCSDLQFCSNNDGSYSCIACDVACDGCSAAGADSCKTCGQRHFLDGSTCTRCHPSCADTCTDTTPSSCDSCAEGWSLDAETNTCLDIDECSDGQRTCDQKSYCVNTEGSSRCSPCSAACEGCTGPAATDCVQCKTGFTVTPPSTECTDVDECSGATVVCLPETEKCVNTVGAFRCDCADGYQRRQGKCEPKKKSSSSKKKKEKSKSNGKQTADFDSSPLTKDMGDPVEGKPFDDMLVMEGSSVALEKDDPNQHRADL